VREREREREIAKKEPCEENLVVLDKCWVICYMIMWKLVDGYVESGQGKRLQFSTSYMSSGILLELTGMHPYPESRPIKRYDLNQNLLQLGRELKNGCVCLYG
jgi:hypothetical protein